jgi:hypothetical protein
MAKLKIRIGGEWVVLGGGSGVSDDTLTEANAYTDQIKELLEEDLDQLRIDVANTDEYIDNAFRDGIITEVEAKKIKAYLNTLASSKQEFDSRYTEIYNNTYLPATRKTSLQTAKNNYDSKYDALILSIQTAITDSKATPEESTDVDAKFLLYQNAISLLASTLELCIDDIGKAYTDGQVTPLDNRLIQAESSITTNSSEIALRVTRDELNADLVTNLNAANNYTDSQKELLDSDVTALQTQINETDEYIDNAFKDGIIYDVEYRKIKAFLNDLNGAKMSFDNRYNEVYNNVDLTSVPKTNLETAKMDYDASFVSLVDSINSAILDQLASPEEAADVDLKFESYNNALALLVTSLEVGINEIAKKKTSDAQAAAEEYADGLKADLDVDVANLQLRIDDTDEYIDTAFKDGVISETEAKRIESYLNTLEESKQTFDNRYNELYLNAYLTGVPKTNLYQRKSDFDLSYNNLLSKINTAIADGATTVTEANDVDFAFYDYNNDVASLVSGLEKAIDTIAQAKADEAEFGANGYADGLYGPLETRVETNEASITTNAGQIALRVTQEVFNQEIINTRGYTDEQVQAAEGRANQYVDDQLTSYVTAATYNVDIQEIQSQIDGSISTWFGDVEPTLTNEPAVNWGTEADKNVHLGDLYYDNITGYSYRFMNNGTTYQWTLIQDSDIQKALQDAAKAQDTADGKRRVFVATPAPPYDIGDLWTQGTAGELMRCQVSKAPGQLYAASDWVKATKYTDDTRAVAAESNAKTYAEGKAAEAQTAAETYAAAQASLAQTQAEAYADGVVSDEEQARINQAAANLAEAKTHADTAASAAQTAAEDFATIKAAAAQSAAEEYALARATAAQTAAEAHADGIVTAEEQARIDDVNAKLVLAKTHADTKAAEAQAAAEAVANAAQDTADAAAASASAAQTAADNAQTSATTANNLLTDMSSDSKLTALEKQDTKKEWDVIVAEKPTIEAQATTYAIGTNKTNYVNAYNALSTYISPLLTSLTTTSTIVGTDFRAKFKDYYDKRTILLKEIAESAKTKADAAQSTANNAKSTADTLKNTTVPAIDSRLSTAEANIVLNADSIALRVTETTYNQGIIDTKAYADTQATNAYNNAKAIADDAQDSADVANAAASAAQTAANNAQTSANTANNLLSDLSNDNKLTAVEKQQTKLEWDGIVAEAPTLTAQADVYSITTEKTAYVDSYNALSAYINPLLSNLGTTSNITATTFRINFSTYYDKRQALLKKITDLAKSKADSAQSTANNAKSTADTLKNTTVPALDNRVSTAEASITTNATQIALRVTETTYNTGLASKQDADSRIDNLMSTAGLPYTTDLIIYGESNKYYPVYIRGGNQDLIRTIKIWRRYSEQAPSDWYSSTHKGSLMLTWKGNFGGWGGAVYKEYIEEYASQYTPLLADLYRSVHSMGYTFFLRGGGTTGAIYHFASDQSINPEVYYNGSADKVYDNANDTYDVYAYEPMTSVDTDRIDSLKLARTNEAEAFANQAYLDAKAIADAAQADADTAQSTANSANAAAAAAQSDANTANSLLSDLSSDSKLTAVEKQQTKLEWDGIVAEKPTLEAQATTYAITTEKTNYVNAYNALSTYITPLLTSLTSTSTITAATFRSNFSNYYDTRQALLKKVTDLAKSKADSAQTTANSANSTANTLKNTTVPALDTRVTTAESSITQNASNIELKVSKNGVISSINQSSESIKINADTIDLVGKVKAEHLDVLAKNLIANPTETGTTYGWNGGSVIGSSVKNADVLSLSTDGSMMVISDKFSVNPNQSYKISASLYKSTSTGSNYFGFYCYDKNGTKLAAVPFEISTREEGSATSNPYFFNNGGELRTSDNDYVQMEAYLMANGTPMGEFPTGRGVHKHFRLPSDTTHVEIRFLNYYNTSGSVTNLAIFSPSVVPVDAGMLSFDQAKGGQLTLGGTGNGNGKLVVLDENNEVIADLDATRGGFSELYVDKLESPSAVNYSDATLDFYVAETAISGYNVDPNDSNAGDGWAAPLASIAEAVRRIPRYFDGTARITLAYGHTIRGGVDIKGFVGNGTITIDGQHASTKINGNVGVGVCAPNIAFENVTINGLAGSYACVSFYQCNLVNMISCKVYGNGSSRALDVTQGTYAQIQVSEFYDASHCIDSRYGATTWVRDCKGYGTGYGLYGYGGYFVGYGAAPNGATFIGLSSGGENFTSFTANNGSYSPPAPPETTTTWNSSTTSATYRLDFNYWDDDTFNNQVLQGYWGGYGLYEGCWFFGTGVKSAVQGTTIKKMRLYVTRLSSGGYSSGVTVTFRYHNYSARPSGNPSLSSTYTQATFAWGESKWITIPSSFYSAFQGGTAQGIGIYTSSTSGSYYAKFSQDAKLEITYG